VTGCRMQIYTENHKMPSSPPRTISGAISSVMLAPSIDSLFVRYLSTSL